MNQPFIRLGTSSYAEMGIWRAARGQPAVGDGQNEYGRRADS